MEVDKDDLTHIVKTVRQAMDMIVPGPMSVMKWIETEVSQSIKRGATDAAGRLVPHRRVRAAEGMKRTVGS